MKKERGKQKSRVGLKSHLFWKINLATITLLAVYFIVFIKVDSLNYYPETPFLELETFTDQEKQGNSYADFKVLPDSTIDFVFQLGEKDPNPYAGINFNHVNDKPINLSRYNSVSIEFTPKELEHMSFFLNVVDDNVRNKSHVYADRRMLADLYVDKNKGRQTSTVSFEETASPNWWFEQLDQSKKEFDRPDWSRLTSMSISNGINSEAGIYHEFKIHQIIFYRDYTSDLVFLLSVQAGVSLVTLFLFFVGKSRSEKIEINYKPVYEDKESLDTPEFLTYIHQHFSDAELSLSIIAKNTGVGQKTISDYISDNYQCNLKTYINQIRISEAKRLLKSSKLNINEVAFKVGFNSPGHFNRVFKQSTGKTPSEYSKCRV